MACPASKVEPTSSSDTQRILQAKKMREKSIRLATMEDASSLAAISLEVWLSTYIQDGVNAFFADYVLDHFTADHFCEILSSKHETIWVSQNIVGIDGFIRLSSQSTPPSDSCSNLEIASLYVQPRHQKNWRAIVTDYS